MSDTYVVSTDNSNLQDYPLFLQAVSGDTPLQSQAVDYRHLISSVFTLQGVVGLNDCGVSQRAAGGNYSVDIGAGKIVITGATGMGKYLCVSYGSTNLPTPSAPVSGTRIHRLVAEVLDKQYSGTSYGWQYHLLEDIGSGTPAEPVGATTLALISISSSSPSVLNAQITDARTVAGRFGMGAWVNYSPLMTSTGTYPAIGTGGSVDLSARWRRIFEKEVEYEAHWRFGTTGTTAGTGNWIWSLPTAAMVTAGRILNGTALFYKNDGGSFAVGMTYLLDSGHVGAINTNNNSAVTNVQPWAWQPGHEGWLRIRYSEA
jgi:hypothetical protein